MKSYKLEDLPSRQPDGHDGFSNRRLASRALGADGSVTVSHATVRPGGHSSLHTHEGSLQIYVVLAGTMVAGDGQTEYRLEPLSAVIIGRGEPHFITNRSDEVASVLVITAPEPEAAGT